MTQVSATKYLGIVIDENLSWRELIDCVGKQVIKSVAIVRRVR